tara:strand:+ start:7985 stop:8176 length:192 start_codon:yes stop_codon:yes gene_type:complete
MTSPLAVDLPGYTATTWKLSAVSGVLSAWMIACWMLIVLFLSIVYIEGWPPWGIIGRVYYQGL